MVLYSYSHSYYVMLWGLNRAERLPCFTDFFTPSLYRYHKWSIICFCWITWICRWPWWASGCHQHPELFLCLRYLRFAVLENWKCTNCDFWLAKFSFLSSIDDVTHHGYLINRELLHHNNSPKLNVNQVLSTKYGSWGNSEVIIDFKAEAVHCMISISWVLTFLVLPPHNVCLDFEVADKQNHTCAHCLCDSHSCGMEFMTWKVHYQPEVK